MSRPEQIRAMALLAAVYHHHHSTTSANVRHTAQSFERYIRGNEEDPDGA